MSFRQGRQNRLRVLVLYRHSPDERFHLFQLTDQQLAVFDLRQEFLARDEPDRHHVVFRVLQVQQDGRPGKRRGNPEALHVQRTTLGAGGPHVKEIEQIEVRRDAGARTDEDDRHDVLAAVIDEDRVIRRPGMLLGHKPQPALVLRRRESRQRKQHCRRDCAVSQRE